MHEEDKQKKGAFPIKHLVKVYGISGNHEFDLDVVKGMRLLGECDVPFCHSGGGGYNDVEPAFEMEDSEEIAGKTVVIIGSPTGFKGEAHFLQRVGAAKQIFKAKTVIAAMPFMRYRRQEREAKPGEIPRLPLYINQIKAAGADILVTCDPHSLKWTQHYCDQSGLQLRVCDPVGVYAQKIITDFMPSFDGPDNVVVLSPDLGGSIRAIKLAEALRVPVVIIQKKRLFSDTVSSEETFDQTEFLQKVREKYGKEIKVPISCDLKQLENKCVIIIDDEVSTAGTAATIGKRILEIGARETMFIATHPVCAPGWQKKLFLRNGPNPFKVVLLGNTRKRGYEGDDRYEETTGGGVVTVSIAPAFAATLIDTLGDVLTVA